MKKTKFLCTVLAVVTLLVALALMSFAAETEYTSGVVNYIVLSDGSVKITEYTGTGANYTIPSKISGKTVSVIGRYAFSEEKNLKTLTIPGSVKEIEQQAIYSCRNLTTVTVKAGNLKTVYNTSIENCISLKTISIPKNVESIGVLMGCTSLQKININADNTYLKSYNGVVYSKDGKNLIKYPQGKKTERFIVPSGVQKIVGNAFYETADSVKEIYVPKTVKNIEETAFAYSFAKICYEGSKVPASWKNALAGKTIVCNSTALGKTSKITSSNTSSTVTLKWNNVPGATGYRVYQSVNGKWKAIKTTTGNSYKVTGLKLNVSYKFAVKAYAKTVSGYVWASTYTTFTTKTKLATPALRVATTAKGRATVAWNDITGETGYQVWYSTKSASGYKKIANYKANTEKIYKTGLTSGKTYYFKVRAYTKVNGKYVYSNYSSVKSLKIK